MPQAAWIERQQSADQNRRQRRAGREVDRKQPEQRHAQETKSAGACSVFDISSSLSGLNFIRNGRTTSGPPVPC